MDSHERYLLVIRSEPSGYRVPAIQRLRGLLKVMLRQFGFKVILLHSQEHRPSREELDEWLNR